MSTPQQQPPAPGWYPDPRAPQNQRYWDGMQWTQDVQQPQAQQMHHPQ
ncbi:MAG: DUF2510 domain-containing protein, partial [Nocardioidaceae bacterium]